MVYGNTLGKDATTASFKWRDTYGIFLYNHKLIYTNNSYTYYGTYGNGNSYNDTNSIQYDNYHNTTLLFSNSKLLE